MTSKPGTATTTTSPSEGPGSICWTRRTPNGTIEIRDGVPHLRRRHDAEADSSGVGIRSRALAGAASLKEDIQRRTGTRLWVQTVVVFWAEFPGGLYEDDRCVFVHGSRLRAWLKERPSKMDETATSDFAGAVADIAQA